uniref:Antistasin-like domain-containing protein n=1 Tax=Ciona savignyi TaxID=51511 RepID=H2Z280_CIOSA
MKLILLVTITICLALCDARRSHIVQLRHCVGKGLEAKSCAAGCPVDCGNFGPLRTCMVGCMEDGGNHNSCIGGQCAGFNPCAGQSPECFHSKLCKCAKCMKTTCTPDNYGVLSSVCPRVFNSLHC